MLVIERSLDVPRQWDASPLGDEGLLPLSFDDDLKHLVGFSVRLEGRLVVFVDLGHRYLEFDRQRLGQGLFHDPIQGRQAMQVVSQPVVFHQTPKLGLEQGHDREVTVIDEFGARQDFAAVLAIPTTFLLDDLLWDTKANVAIDAASLVSVPFGILVERVDFIVEKPRAFCPGMGNQGFGLGEVQFEGLT